MSPNLTITTKWDLSSVALEHLADTEEVNGSSPLDPTKKQTNKLIYRRKNTTMKRKTGEEYKEYVKGRRFGRKNQKVNKIKQDFINGAYVDPKYNSYKEEK